MTRWRAALALAAALALGGASGSGSGSDLSDLSDLSAASDGGGSTAAVFSLERDANASTSSADVLRVVAALSSGEELAIPFQALAADSWNLSSWGNVLAQLGNAVANYDLELDAVQINVRLDEPAGPSLVHFSLDQDWEYGPSLAFSNGSLAGLSQLSALYVTGFNLSVSSATWLPDGVDLDQIILQSSTLESFDIDAGVNVSDFVIRESSISEFPTAILDLDTPVSKIILEFNNITGPIKLTTSQYAVLEGLDVVANSNSVSPSTSSECKKTETLQGLPVCIIATNSVGDGFTSSSSTGDTSGGAPASDASPASDSSASALTTSTAASGESKLTTAAIVLACVCAGVMVVGATFFRKLKQRMNKNTADQITLSSNQDVFLSPARGNGDDNDNGRLSSASASAARASSASAAVPKEPHQVGILPAFDLGKDKVSLQRKMGAHGLWRATLEERKVVALKLDPHALRLSFPVLNAALETYVPFKHKNIVQFIGSCLTSMDDVLIVVEMLEKGSLRSVLLDEKVELSWAQRLQMCADIANGLAHLRSLDPPAPISYHLTAKSVLCGADLTCKLDIFDYAERMRDSRTPVVAFGDGDIASRAPELLDGGDVAAAAEVYALGVLMCEISLRHRVFDDVLEEQGPTLGDITIAQEVAAGKRAPEPAADAPVALREAVARCVARDPNDRATIAEIAQLLSSAVEQDAVVAPAS